MVSPEEENTVPDSPMNRGTENDCSYKPVAGNPHTHDTWSMGRAVTLCLAQGVGVNFVQSSPLPEGIEVW